ncbi:MAG TPA: hypothetical protein VMG08_09120 [Allosphingosinicella sp.]|nr:hypothetical protein [Allosphingosinicella sp.]
MLFRQDDLRRIMAGEVTLAFRRWTRAGASTGGRQRTNLGVVAFDSVEIVAEDALTEADARAAGHPDRAALLAPLKGRDGGVYRIAVSPAGADPRVAKRADTDVTDLAARLDRLDGATPWTRQTLRLIAGHEGVRAAELAVLRGQETLLFKRAVRRLKELGLTESLETGYRISPRGRAFLDSDA